MGDLFVAWSWSVVSDCGLCSGRRATERVFVVNHSLVGVMILAIGFILAVPESCEFGLEGLVSKHRDRAYRAGTSPYWVKVKNPKHPAMQRVKETFRNGS
jgi:hypothetical protein